ncbi:CD166 antigen homolog A isoform X2 [Stegostoma tigrinum]|uniref:CD166 antigen homolog A isoform X2 n=1 Tax=Stegostoma tigrinum TaxID=3053191 RepID=UPI00286FF831|nr:CD166 antigen homolog A isoform X2 [Stegostoma tigrinum]
MVIGTRSASPAVQAMTTVTAMVGDTVTLPCEAKRFGDLNLVSWRVKLTDTSIEQLISYSSSSSETKMKDIPEYKDRILLNKNFFLNITDVGIKDERVFSCFTLVGSDIDEVPVALKVYKTPSNPEIMALATFLNEGVLQKVGVCVVNNSYPMPNITWQHNYKDVDLSSPDVNVTNNVVTNKNGFYEIQSSLRYSSRREEGKISFTCMAIYFEGLNKTASKESSPVTLLIHYKSSKISLEVTPAQDVEEGTNVTMSCSGDGYPPPEKFNFMKNGEEKVVATDHYGLINVTQDDTGEYTCSEQDNPDIKDAVNVTVHYLTLTMNPNENVSKMVGENITLECLAFSSGALQVTLMKKNRVYQTPLRLDSLQYVHSGTYTCSAKLVEVKEMKREKTIIVRVEGKPRITKLTKKVVNNTKVITCVVEGFPKPIVQWSINGTAPREESVKDRKSQWSHKITVQPSENITVTCLATNAHGQDQDTVNLTAMRFKEPVDETLEQDPADPRDKKNDGKNDQAKVIVGVIVGLLIAAVIAGVVYWLYKKKSPTSKTKTNERGTADEIKKINKGDNNHTSGSSAV